MKVPFLLLFSFCFTIFASETANDAIPQPMFTRILGPVSQKQYSYAAAMIAAFYSLPTVQRAFYEASDAFLTGAASDTSPLTLMIAGYFSKLRTVKGSLILDDKFLQTLNSVFKKDLGSSFMCATSFVSFLLSLQPENITKLFQIQIEASILDSDTLALVKKKMTVSSNIEMHASSPPFSIVDFIANNLVTPSLNATEKIIKDKSGNDVVFKLSRKITNHPEIITISIDRLLINDEERTFRFNNRDTVFFPREIEVNGAQYVLAANVELNLETLTYSTVVRDFGNSQFYRYTHDGVVTRIGADASVLADNVSMLVYYVKKDSTQVPCPVPELLMSVISSKRSAEEVDRDLEEKRAKMMRANEEMALKELEARDPMLKWLRIYKPDYSLYDDSFTPLFIAAEANINSNIAHWSADILNMAAKFLYGTFVLGSESYSFRPSISGEPYTAFEIVLSSLAADFDVVSRVFESMTSKNNSKQRASIHLELVNEHLAKVLVQMLLGCKQISLENLVGVVSVNRRVSPGFFHQSCDPGKLNEQIWTLVSAINCKLIGLPALNVITFATAHCDDPVSVKSRSLNPLLLTKKLVEPRTAIIRGVWFDCADQKSRERFVYSHPVARQFPFAIDRKRRYGGRQNPFENQKFYFNSEDFICTGFVSLNQGANGYRAVFFNPAHKSYVNLIPGRESSIHGVSQDTTNEFFTNVESSSVQLFFARKSSGLESPLLSRIIPGELFTAALKERSENEVK